MPSFHLRYCLNLELCSSAGTSQHPRHAITLLPKISPIIPFCNHSTAISPLFLQIFLVLAYSPNTSMASYTVFHSNNLVLKCFLHASMCPPFKSDRKNKQTNKKQVAAWPILVFNFSLCPLPHLLHLPHPCVGLSYVSTEEYSQLYILAQLEVKNSFMLWKQKVSSNWSQGGWLLATRPPVHMTKCEGMWLSTGHRAPATQARTGAP